MRREPGGNNSFSNTLLNMAVKVIYIAGVPASGKTTLLKMVRNELFAGASSFREGKVRGIESPDGHYKMLGVFDGSLFEGTDRLSMTVIGDAISYIKALEAAEGKYVVFVEGDRLFNARFIAETKATLLLIDANEKVLHWRHSTRGDSQNDTFLRSRRTKVENYIRKHRTMRIWNNTPEDQKRILAFILKTATEYVRD